MGFPSRRMRQASGNQPLHLVGQGADVFDATIPTSLCRQRGGCQANPTPSALVVIITSPGSKGQHESEKRPAFAATSKNHVHKGSAGGSSPLTDSDTASRLASDVYKPNHGGPQGSLPVQALHLEPSCPWRACRSRAVMPTMV